MRLARSWVRSPVSASSSDGISGRRGGGSGSVDLAGQEVPIVIVEAAIGQQNIELPAGRVESQQREFTVTARTDLNRPEEFAAIIVKQAKGYPVRIRDIGRVDVDAASVRSRIFRRGVDAFSRDLGP